MPLADWQLIGCLVAYAVIVRAFYGRLVSYVIGGKPWHAATMVVFVSPVMLALIITFCENRSLVDFANLSREPWSLIFGDTFVLATATAIAAISARHWPIAMTSRSWWYGCLAVGMLAGLGFHLLDVSNYRRLGAANLTDAFSKVYHDGVVYPVLFGAFTFVTIAMIRFGRGWLRITYLLCLGIWVLLAARDATAGLNPHDFHTACNVVCGAHNLNTHLHFLHGIVDTVRGWLVALHVA
jgi:hypothetical protein